MLTEEQKINLVKLDIFVAELYLQNALQDITNINEFIDSFEDKKD